MQKAPTTTLHAVVPAKEIENMTHTRAGGGAKGRKKKKMATTIYKDVQKQFCVSILIPCDKFLWYSS
jgi:hypothetical protein